MTLNFWFSYLHLLSSGVIGTQQYGSFYVMLGSKPRDSYRTGKHSATWATYVPDLFFNVLKYVTFVFQLCVGRGWWSSVCGSQRRAPDPVELNLQAVSQEPPNMSASNQSSVWREKHMLLTAEPPLQSLIFYSYILHTNSSKCIWKFVHRKNCPFKNIFLGPGEKVQSIKPLTDN